MGWRLLLFLILYGPLVAVVGLIAPRSVAGEGATHLVAALAAGWIVLGLEGKTPGALGFHLKKSVPKELAGGLGLGVGVAATAVTLMALAGVVSWGTESGSAGRWLLSGLGALWLFTLPAAAEEALLRGYPLQALTEAWGPAAGLGITSVAFGLLHLGNPGVSWLAVGNIVLAGLLLGTVYLRTGSLWWATGVHLGWNWALGFGADLPVSGLDLVDAPYLAARITGPAWLGGGGFGPEGSALSGIVLAGAVAWVWGWRRSEPGTVDEAGRPLWLSASVTGERERG